MSQSHDSKRALLLVGRWHGITRDQEKAIASTVARAGDGKLVFVITAAKQERTKRHPLTVDERKKVVFGLAQSLDRPFEIYAVEDISDSSSWVKHLRDVVKQSSGGGTDLDPSSTVLLSSNPDVLGLFTQAGYASIVPDSRGKLPLDLHAAIRAGGDWKALANDSTRKVFEEDGLVEAIASVFRDVLLNADGELSTGRDYGVYKAGMDASGKIKIDDVGPYLIPGRIVDKGCGTGLFLKYLSERFPDAEIVGMDLSSELLHTSESNHYANHNVAVVRGNIIEQRFPDGSLHCVSLMSVVHEVFSYNGYDREKVRLLMRNTRRELALGGRVIIRDGIKPKGADDKIWMRCDAESEERFRRFAHDFKNKSACPGVPFEEARFDDALWFHLSLHGANEFLSKKDYLTNWAMEVNEEFGVFTLDEWNEELSKLGYRVLVLRSYLNDWIKTNRYDNRVWLHANANGRPGLVLPYPDTTAVIVAEAI